MTSVGLYVRKVLKVVTCDSLHRLLMSIWISQLRLNIEVLACHRVSQENFKSISGQIKNSSSTERNRKRGIDAEVVLMRNWKHHFAQLLSIMPTISLAFGSRSWDWALDVFAEDGQTLVCELVSFLYLFPITAINLTLIIGEVEASIQRFLLEMVRERIGTLRSLIPLKLYLEHRRFPNFPFVVGVLVTQMWVPLN